MGVLRIRLSHVTTPSVELNQGALNLTAWFIYALLVSRAEAIGSAVAVDAYKLMMVVNC